MSSCHRIGSAVFTFTVEIHPSIGIRLCPCTKNSASASPVQYSELGVPWMPERCMEKVCVVVLLNETPMQNSAPQPQFKMSLNVNKGTIFLATPQMKEKVRPSPVKAITTRRPESRSFKIVVLVGSCGIDCIAFRSRRLRMSQRRTLEVFFDCQVVRMVGLVKIQRARKRSSYMVLCSNNPSCSAGSG